MSYWNAKYTNGLGEYEITFASKNYEKAKVVEKICQAVMDDRIRTPEELESKLRALESSGWISVEERLPDRDKTVLCCKDDRMRIGYYIGAGYSKGVAAFIRPKDQFAFGVTHWMPLPEAPGRKYELSNN